MDANFLNLQRVESACKQNFSLLLAHSRLSYFTSPQFTLNWQHTHRQTMQFSLRFL